MTKREQMERIRLFRAVDLSPLLEEPNFIEIFCDECGRRGCALDSPDDFTCPRQGYWQEIADALDRTTNEIVGRVMAARA